MPVLDGRRDHGAQRQTSVTAYLNRKQLLPFVIAWLSLCQYSMAEEIMEPKDKHQ